MPLRAILNDINLFAFEQTLDSWSELKSSKKRTELVMPCCGERAIAKTSSQGSFFFSHYRKNPDCESKPESKEHIILKNVIAIASKKAGWDVVTEYPGSSFDGQNWVADVYCTKEKKAVAFEVQLSKQSLREFNYRQERFRRSGVRSAWFVSEAVYNSANTISSKELPVFIVKEFSCRTDSPIVAQFGVSLDKFIRSLLLGRVSWETDLEELHVHYIQDTCWSCEKSVRQPFAYGVDVYFERVKTVPNCSTVLKKILDYVGNDSLLSSGINKIVSHPNFKGNIPSFPYSAECNHCGQPQANSGLIDKLKDGYDEEHAESFVIGTCNGRWEYKE